MSICRATTALLIASAILSPLAAQDSARVIALPPVELHGFVEVHYRTGDPTTKDGFRLRKADFKFTGELSPHTRWRLGFDAAKVLTITKTVATKTDSLALSDAAIDQKSRILQDAAITYTFNQDLNVDVGQQILPLGLEGGIPLSQIETIERSNISAERSRAVGLGDVRDIGASINGRATSQLEYHVGVFNETGDDQGTTDANDQKAVVGRLVVHPSLLPNIQVGGTGAYEGGSVTQHRERGGADIQYRDNWLTLRTEAMSARDGLLHRFGWYGLGAVRPTTRLQLAARYDSWDRDRTHESSGNDAFERQIVVGGSYLVDGASTKFALNVIRQTFPNISSVRPSTFLLAAFSGVW
ncbi:MAG: hypothetical protein JWM41_1217 [Gemmatimonadetes bacterium]|nr:hypothetical protein [Gemmatimonadota bacterium]